MMYTSTKGTHMEILDLDILNMISDLEADIEVPDFDEDDDADMLN